MNQKQIETAILNNKKTSSYQLGVEVMGPILAECCFCLHQYLTTKINTNNSCVLYCARGGLLIKRALDIYLLSTEQKVLSGANLMVSRLAAARLALIVSPNQIEDYLALEFEGRECGEVVKALTGITPTCSSICKQPYTLNLLLEILDFEESGVTFKARLTEQAEFFRNHFLSLVKDRKEVHIVDTGVFGSIGHFLQVGFPDLQIHSVLLFRANYKFNIKRPLSRVTGLVCNEDYYVPWIVQSTSRLYWPFIEAFFEPNLPSVCLFKQSSDGSIVSNLQIPNWEERLNPAQGTIVDGAFRYLANIDSRVLHSISSNSIKAWQSLRKKIVFPKNNDIILLSVQSRGLDFGFDDVVNFEYKNNAVIGIMARIKNIRSSIWWEGETKKLFPHASIFILFGMELYRCIMAFFRSARVYLKKLHRSRQNSF